MKHLNIKAGISGWMMVITISCGGSDLKKTAEEVCDCYKKAITTKNEKDRDKCRALERKILEKHGPNDTPESQRIYKMASECLDEWTNHPEQRK